MKVITGLLAGVGMLVASVAGAQVYGQTYGQVSVSGYVLSYGSMGFRLQGPDGVYGIATNFNTVFTDPWNNAVSVGPQNPVPGMYVTATGYPASQWFMRATVVATQNGYPAAYGGYGTTVISGIGSPTVNGPFPSSFSSLRPSPIRPIGVVASVRGMIGSSATQGTSAHR